MRKKFLKEDLLPDEVYNTLVRKAKKTYSVGVYSTSKNRPGYHYEINTENGVYTQVPDSEGFIAHWFLQSLPQENVEDVEEVVRRIVDEYDCREVSLDEYKRIVNGVNESLKKNYSKLLKEGFGTLYGIMCRTTARGFQSLLRMDDKVVAFTSEEEASKCWEALDKAAGHINRFVYYSVTEISGDNPKNLLIFDSYEEYKEYSDNLMNKYNESLKEDMDTFDKKGLESDLRKLFGKYFKIESRSYDGAKGVIDEYSPNSYQFFIPNADVYNWQIEVNKESIKSEIRKILKKYGKFNVGFNGSFYTTSDYYGDKILHFRWFWFSEKLNEDTVKTRDGKWTNKGKEGTHGKFKTKKEADAQRRAMFSKGYHESVDKFFVVVEYIKDFKTSKTTISANTKKELEQKLNKLNEKHRIVDILQKSRNIDGINHKYDGSLLVLESMPILKKNKISVYGDNMKENLKEDFWWDEEDSFFTRDDLNDFRDELEDVLDDPDITIGGVYLEPGNLLEVDWEYEGYENTASERIDMRRIRNPRDLIRVYLQPIRFQIMRGCGEILELNESLNKKSFGSCHLKEDLDVEEGESELYDLAYDMVEYLHQNKIPFVNVYKVYDEPIPEIVLYIYGNQKQVHSKANHLLKQEFGDRIKSIQEDGLDGLEDYSIHVIRLK